MSTLEGNKRVVTDYYQTAFAGNPEQAVADHFGDQYIQHNPQAQNVPRPSSASSTGCAANIPSCS